MANGRIKIFLKKVWEKDKARRKELDRDLDFFETDIFNFLRLVFIKSEIGEDIIRKKRRLSKNRFDDIINFLIDKKYVSQIMVSKPRSNIFYEVTSAGVDYLLEFKRSMEEATHAYWIKMATIVLAISAAIQAIDILVNRPTTTTFLSNQGVSFIAWFAEFLSEVFKVGIAIFILWAGYNIAKFFVDRIDKKKKSQVARA